jgi:hypothetical protein
MVMIAILLKGFLSIILTLVGIAVIILAIYWLLLLSSIITGLLGMFGVSEWFRRCADALSNRILKVFSILKGKSNE